VKKSLEILIVTLLLTPVAKPDLDILTKHFASLATKDRIDRSRFRDMLAGQFQIGDSLIMDRGTLIVY
jgi:hypothetical protein